MLLRAGAIVIALALGVGAAVAASPTPTPTPQYTPEEAHAGCIHTDLRLCMITLGAALWFDMKKVAPEIALRNETDVNGKTAHRTLDIVAAVPGHTERIAIVLTLASPPPNDTVVKAQIWLPIDPELAHTPSEYDKTFLYDLVVPLLGKRCPSLDRMTLYRFYENDVKTHEKEKIEAVKGGLVNRTVETVDTGMLPFCGASFSVHKRAEWQGPPELARPRSLNLVSYIQLE
jgi:hypothetical protein